MKVYIVMRNDLDSESSIEGVFENYLDAVDFRILRENRAGSICVTFEIEEWEVE